MEEHTKALYHYIKSIYSNARKKCEENHKNCTYDPFLEGVNQGIETAYLGFFQFFDEDELLKICEVQKEIS